MPHSPKPMPVLLALALLALAGSAMARTTDRKQPMDIDAGHQVCTSGKVVTCTFTQKVTVTQGTLRIDADNGVIVQADGKPSNAQFHGGVDLHQQMDDGSQLSARSANLDYDLRNDIIVLTGTVTVQQNRGTLSGERVSYNIKTGQIESGGSGRVKMRIIPKDAEPGSP